LKNRYNIPIILINTVLLILIHSKEASRKNIVRNIKK
jgi:hypothetical protein